MDEDLDRFVRAQHGVYETALAELQQGQKRSHWMWFIFPQLRGLGQSDMAWRYGLQDLDEARAFLSHPVLGPRLLACAGAVIRHGDLRAETIFGTVDAMKLRSSATLFEAAGAEPFATILALFFDGSRCTKTEALLAD